MNNPFERPIVNSSYEYPHQHWELDDSGQPTGALIPKRRRAEFITPIPRPKKRKASKQVELNLDQGPSTANQKYDLTSIINEVRQRVDAWRTLPVSHSQLKRACDGASRRSARSPLPRFRIGEELPVREQDLRLKAKRYHLSEVPRRLRWCKKSRSRSR